ncbi:MAG: hypothetical protein K6T29_06505 [Peptococcaceae bacterium]|nr:hypothetical protein [Peptococcaceae bacterium]
MGYGKKSILLVEDSILTRFPSKRLLENNCYEVTEANSGEEALARAAQKTSKIKNQRGCILAAGCYII